MKRFIRIYWVVILCLFNAALSIASSRFQTFGAVLGWLVAAVVSLDMAMYKRDSE